MRSPRTPFVRRTLTSLRRRPGEGIREFDDFSAPSAEPSSGIPVLPVSSDGPVNPTHATPTPLPHFPNTSVRVEWAATGLPFGGAAATMQFMGPDVGP